MVIPPPPTKPIVPGAANPGDISKGLKVTMEDIAHIAAGGAPGTLYIGTTMDEDAMPAVPPGIHRVIQSAFAWSEEQASELVLGIRRLGVDYYLVFDNGEVIATIGADAVTYTAYPYPTVTAKGFTLQPGDILFAQDFIATGGDIILSVMYVDVYL